ncbi:MAG: hypothetical protein ABSH28_09590 [Acidobacteriota bacterium]
MIENVKVICAKHELARIPAAQVFAVERKTRNKGDKEESEANQGILGSRPGMSFRC